MVVLTLALALAPRRAAADGLAGAWPWARGWLAAVFPWIAPAVTASGCDRGSMIDPDGRCVTAAVVVTASGCDHGSMIDPNGGCVPSQ